MKNYQRSSLVSVHRTKRPCPVCGRRDNCAVSDTGTYCRRVPSQHQGRDGGWWHPNDDSETAPRPVLRVAEKSPAPLPTDRRARDLVFQTLLRSLPLFTPHRENLQARGLDEIAVHRGLFKSTPPDEEVADIVSSIAAQLDLAGVPGFYKDREDWRLVKMPSGFFIPILDRDGLIQGLQIRCDYLRHPKDSRYRWLSSRGFPSGTSSGAPVHVQNPERIEATGRCIITEGSLKSFIASCYLSPDEGGLLAVSGTSAFRENFGHQIKAVWPGLHTAICAFDADWSEKREIKQSLRRLVASLKAAAFESVLIRTWEPKRGKGIDDLLTAETSEVLEVAVA